MAQGYSNDMFRARADARAAERPFEINFSIPKEGAVLALDSFVIHRSGGRPDLAHAFINFMLDGDNAADVSNLIGAGNPNRAALPFIRPEAAGEPAIFPPPETLARLDLPTAFSEDAGVVIEAVVADHDPTYHLTRLDFPGGSVVVARRQESLGRRLRFRVHARDVSLTLTRAEGTSIANLLPATVTEVADADTPAHVLVRLDAGGTPLIARITRRSLDHLGVRPGQSLWTQIKAVALLT